MEGDPKVNPRTTITKTGSSTAQTNPVKRATSSLLSHWRRADTGKVMCHDCVPDVFSSHRERPPARMAINGVNKITGVYRTSCTPSGLGAPDSRKSRNLNAVRQVKYARLRKLISQTGRNKRSSLRIKLSAAPV